MHRTRNIHIKFSSSTNSTPGNVGETLHVQNEHFRKAKYCEMLLSGARRFAIRAVRGLGTVELLDFHESAQAVVNVALAVSF